MKLTVFLHKDRTNPGVIILTDGANIAWRAPCYGKSDNTRAKEAGNPERNPLRPFGDIPAGEWKGRIVPASGPGRVYGPHKRILLTAVSGDALIAMSPKNKDGDGDRYNILIHGGALNAAGWFRPTYGCLRLTDDDEKELISWLETAGIGELPIQIIELPL